MPGLLDFLDSDEGRMGIGLLMAGSKRSDGAGFGQRLGEGMNYVQAQRENDAKRRFQQVQMDNYGSEMEARKLATIKDQRTQENDARFLGFGGSQPNNSGAPSSGGGGMTSANGDAPGTGGFTAENISKQFNIPIEAVMSDYKFNGGKKIAELISERSKPNWQNINGNLVNTNAQGFSGGLQAGMAASNDGKVTAWQSNGRGGLVVGAPEGALDTFRAYKGVETGLGAAARVNLRKNADGTESPVSELTENPTLQNLLTGRPAASGAKPGYATEAQMKATMSGDMGANPAALAREIKAVQNDLMKPLDEGSKSMLRAQLVDLQRQAANPQVSKSAATPAPTGYGMTNQQAAQAKADEAKLIGTANADVVRDTTQKKENKLYGQLTVGLDRTIALLKDGPTASGVGSLVDSTANFIGMSTKGADKASQLETLSGWLTSNVPRMEGPQSDKDVQQYRIMAAEVGDRTKPVSQRLAAANELQGLQAKYAELNGGAANTGGASGSFAEKPSAGQVFDTKPPAQNYKGKTATGPDGKRYKSDGMIWKEVQ